MRASLLAFLLAGLAACGGADPVGLRHQPRAAIVVGILDGNGQTDTVGRELPLAVVAQVTDDANAAPVAAVVLNWFAVAGADTVFLGAGLTDASGMARYRWTLGRKAGAQTLLAWALDETGARSVHANATAQAVADRAAVLTTLQPTVTAWVGARIVGRALVAAADQFGNPVTEGQAFAFASAPWASVADTIWATDETRGNITVIVDTVAANVAGTALRDLRASAWRMAYSCFQPETPIVGAGVDSAAVSGVVDSVRSLGAPGAGYDLWFTTTTVRRRYAADPYGMTTWTRDTVTARQSMRIGEQVLGGITWHNLAQPRATWDGSGYVGGDLLLCHPDNNGLVWPYTSLELRNR